MELHLKIIGIAFILLAGIHIIFPKFFHWKKELSHLSIINQEIMKVHTFFIAITVFLMGILCINSTNQLLTTKLGKTILFGLAIFWSLRLLTQFFGYSSKTWKGKTFETSAHVFFSIFWCYVSGVFWISYGG
ncbi:hypothetical protein [Wenyingzhuangia sp. IMCC45574]